MNMIGGACVMPSLNRLNPAVTGNLVITKTDFIFGDHAFVKTFDPHFINNPIFCY
jgi:hypothetical protein